MKKKSLSLSLSLTSLSLSLSGPSLFEQITLLYALLLHEKHVLCPQTDDYDDDDCFSITLTYILILLCLFRQKVVFDQSNFFFSVHSL